jgi:hypothetical protein
VKVIQYIAAGLVGALVAGVAVYRLAPRVEVVERVREVRVTVPAEPVPGVTPEDVARLTNEKAALQTRLAEAEASVLLKDGALKQTKEQLAELRRPMEEDIMSSALKAELKSGEVVVTGGYRLPDGKRLYAFAQPLVETVDGEPMVKVEGRLLSLTDEAGKTVGLDNLSTNAANTLQHGEVWVADEQTEVLALLAAENGTSLMTMPRITLKSGASGMLEVGDIKLKVTPTLTGDQGGMNLELRLEQPQVTPVDPPAPAPAAKQNAEEGISP